MNKHLPVLILLLGFGLVGCATNSETGFQIGFLNIEVSEESQYIWDTVLVEDYNNLNKNYPRAEAIDINTGKKFHMGKYGSWDEERTVSDTRRFCELIYKAPCVTSRINDLVLFKDLADYKSQLAAREEENRAYKENQARIRKEWEENSKRREEEQRQKKLAQQQEEKQRLIASLTKRCEDYGFTGDNNIAACIQREAQHDKELEMQKWELERTRIALQQAQSRTYVQQQPEEEEVPLLIQMLGDIAVGVAENLSDPTYIQLQQQQQQINNLKRKNIFKDCKPNC